jgi:hypothetical protein
VASAPKVFFLRDSTSEKVTDDDDDERRRLGGRDWERMCSFSFARDNYDRERELSMTPAGFA